MGLEGQAGIVVPMALVVFLPIFGWWGGTAG